MLIWLAMTTGARRGELCALRLDLLDLEQRRPADQHSYRTGWHRDVGGGHKDSPTTPHRAGSRNRRPAARLHRASHSPKPRSCGVELKQRRASLLACSAITATWLKPNTVTQRYRRMCERLGWDMNIHELRHYSATELITAGVDVRTVAGRLGHGGGGATTLRVYSAWVSEADQRAAGNFSTRMPKAPIKMAETGTITTNSGTAGWTTPTSRYSRIFEARSLAAHSSQATRSQPIVELQARYGVKAGTAHRAIAELKAAGLIKVSRGKRAIVLGPGEEPRHRRCREPQPETSSEVSRFRCR